MISLVLGILLWSWAHLYKRVAPEARARLTEKIGPASKGIFALVIILSIALMVFGYKVAYGPVWWGRSAATVGINNLLMLLAIYLFAASGSKTWITSIIKNPQLTAFKLWCVAHLLVNGDLPSVVLFGGLLAWAVVQVIVLKRTTDGPEPAKDHYPKDKEIKALVATVVVFAVVAGVHTWLGYFPFGS